MANLLYDKQGKVRTSVKPQSVSLYYGKVASIATGTSLAVTFGTAADQFVTMYQDGCTTNGLSLIVQEDASVIYFEVLGGFTVPTLTADDMKLFHIAPTVKVPGGSFQNFAHASQPPIKNQLVWSQLYSAPTGSGAATRELNYSYACSKGPVAKGTEFRFVMHDTSVVGARAVNGIDLELKVMLIK